MEKPNLRESRESEKVLAWEKQRSDIEKITDKLGRKVDEGIKIL
jgi:hypothetical protein